MKSITRALILMAAAAGFARTAHAQATWQPTPAPAVSAENETWYQQDEPIRWSGEYYYRAGAQVFFNQYQMVSAGSFRGIPLYTDATLDPLGIVYVPIGRGLLQPYERRRNGDLAGTTGNRAPSFPTSIGAEGYVERTDAPVPEPRPVAIEEPEVALTPRSVVEAPRPSPGTVERPKGINGVWVTYDGRRMFSAGQAVPLDSHFRQIGTYNGFPVYRRDDEQGTIYIPTADGMAAPYSERRTPNRNREPAAR
jgi:hypothetical protein